MEDELKDFCDKLSEPKTSSDEADIETDCTKSNSEIFAVESINVVYKHKSFKDHDT